MKTLPIVVFVLAACVIVVAVLFYATSTQPNESSSENSALNQTGIQAEHEDDVINNSAGPDENESVRHLDESIPGGPLIYGEVFDALEENPETIVTVMLKQNGPNYSDSMSQTEKNWVFEEQRRINTGIQDEIISNLSSSEFVLISKSMLGSGFYGKINMAGLQKLKENPYINAIRTKIVGGPALSDSVPLINASYIWSIQISDNNITGAGQAVCIIDSGINNSHKDIIGRVIAQQCYCTETIYGGGSGCCNNNQSSQNGSALDDNGHGTHIAGIVAANGTVKGIAPGTKIVSVKVTNSSVNWNNQDLLDGIEWCITNRNVYNISVISTSLVYALFNNSADCDNFYPYITESINKAYNNNIFSVSASGNNGNKTHIAFPACISHVTSVGATNKDDSMASYGNIASILDLLAPGTLINSTNISGSYQLMSGTSMSAPHVAGAAVLLQQYERLANNRNITPAQIEQRLKDTGKLIYDNETGTTFPRIDAYSAIFPIDLYGLERVYASPERNIFRFSIRNNYNNQTNGVLWEFYFGDGGSESNEKAINLSAGEEMDIFFERNWTDGDIYTIRAATESGDVNDSEEMMVTIGDIIAYNLEQLYANGKQRIFYFKILNNMNESKSVNWTLDTDETLLSAIKLMTLQPGEEADIFVQYNYTSEDSYDVIGSAFNGTIIDYTKQISVTVV